MYENINRIERKPPPPPPKKQIHMPQSPFHKHIRCRCRNGIANKRKAEDRKSKEWSTRKKSSVEIEKCNQNRTEIHTHEPTPSTGSESKQKATRVTQKKYLSQWFHHASGWKRMNLLSPFRRQSRFGDSILPTEIDWERLGAAFYGSMGTSLASIGENSGKMESAINRKGFHNESIYWA